MTAGDALIYRGHGCIDLGIRVATCSPASHVAIVDEWGTGIVEATRSGVRRGFLPAAGPDLWVLAGPRDERGVRAGRWAARHVGWRYGWTDYARIAARLVHWTLRGHPRRGAHEALVCSTLVVAALRAAGCDPVPWVTDAADSTPGDLYDALALRGEAR